MCGMVPRCGIGWSSGCGRRAAGNVIGLFRYDDNLAAGTSALAATNGEPSVIAELSLGYDPLHDQALLLYRAGDLLHPVGTGRCTGSACDLFGHCATATAPLPVAATAVVAATVDTPQAVILTL
jgi:hypothetical protein